MKFNSWKWWTLLISKELSDTLIKLKKFLYYENPLTNNYHYYGEFKSKDVFMGIGKSVLKYVFAIYPEYDNSYNYYG